LIYRQKGEKGSIDIPGQSGVPTAWQNTSPELATILENLKRTEQHLQGEHEMSNTDGKMKYCNVCQ